MNIMRFLKNWTLPVAMLAGVLSYLLYASLSLPPVVRQAAARTVAVVQPTLIFTMLFLSYCKVDPKDIRICRWHLWLLLFQVAAFVLLACFLWAFPHVSGQVLAEGAMLCLICPTATAAIVVTGKLGGDAVGLTGYAILISLAVALAVPMFVPLVHPHPELTFGHSFLLIMGKIFPMLILPFFVAMLVRRFLPSWHAAILSCRDLAFYLWGVALAIAIAVTARSIAHSTVAWGYQAGLAAVSLACCALQFWLGRRVGARYGVPIGAAQALGQKNTVFAIWMGYTFMTPVTAIAGGFYSVWHNVYNSYQLYKKRKADAVS